MRRTRLQLYEFDPREFTLEDATAAYYVTAHEVAPISHREVQDPLMELFQRGIELRVLSSLWPLRDAVIASSLGFSIIRMRNAEPDTVRDTP